MKHFIHILLVALTIGVLPLWADNSVVEDTHSTKSTVNPYSGTFTYSVYSLVNIEADGFTLFADSGSLIHPLDIVVTKLPYKGGTAMRSNMENVSGTGDGVRLLPNGEHFSEANPALITLSYDPNRIPRGYKPMDVYTYYCDDAHNWYRLERVSIDTSAHTITSYTTHFTDFANAVIKIPDMPESKAFVPTVMTDLPDADPMHGIPMIEAPTINNKGTADLVYPIELPKGRRGMQPNVDLHYSSAGGNGVLGVGWSLSIPAVTIDTRWGVPRYDLRYETEQYLVNGAPILLRQQDGTAHALPYQDNAYQLRSGGITRFSARDTKNQDRIDRIGTNPTDYWWAVTDRNGVTTYYGRIFNPSQPQDEYIDESSVIRTDSGNIAYWAATPSVDVYGNYIRYINEKQGNTIYLRQIDYTGNCNQQVPPTYRVLMGYQSRSDISSSGRLGVLQTEDSLMCHLLVQYHHPEKAEPNFTENLAAYYMQYDQPSLATLYKSRLSQVVMLDSVHDLLLNDICDLNDITGGHVARNQFSDELLAEAILDKELMLVEEIIYARSHPYGTSVPANVTQFYYANAPSYDSIFGRDTVIVNSNGLELSANHSNSWGIGGTATVGFGPDIVTTLLSMGGNYDYNRSNGECSSMLIDLNGDGLLDLVQAQDGIVWFYKHYKQGNTHAFDNKVQLNGLNRISHEVTETHTWGLQLSFGADLSYSNPISTSYTDTYFSDVNADGLPDLIDGDNILINHLDEHGIPVFGEFTGVNDQIISVHNSRCHGIILDGEVDERIECRLQEEPVYSWHKNTFFGQPVNYGFGAEQVNDENIPYPDVTYANGGSSVSYPNEDSVLHAIDSITGKPIVIPTPEPPRMAKSDRNPLVLNDSLIYRIDGDSVRAYHLHEDECKPVKMDPDIEIVRVWAAPKRGTIILKDSIALLQDTSASRLRSRSADGVAYTIQLCDSVQALSDSMHLHAINYSLLKQGTIADNDYTTHPWADTLQVKKGDLLMFRLRSGDNNRFDKTRWYHIIRYMGETQVYDSERDYICTGDGYYQTNDTGRVLLSFSGRNDGTESVVLKVRKNNQASYLLNSTLPHGIVNVSLSPISLSQHDSIIITLSPSSGSSSEPVWSDVHVIPYLRYISDFKISETPLPYVHDTIEYYPDIRIEHSSFFLESSPYRKLFGPLHKGWGAFAYQDVHDWNIIILDSLVNTQRKAVTQLPPESTMASYNPNITLPQNTNLQNYNKDSLLSRVENVFSDCNVYNPIADSACWIPMHADSRTEKWIAYGNMGCIGKNIHSNAREITLQDTVANIVEYDSPLPFKSGETRKNNFIRKKTRSVQHCLSAGAGIMNSSLSFGAYNGDVDYMDMNGDGYPDFVGKEGIQYSTPWGGIGQLMPVKNYTPYRSDNYANGMAFSACPAKLEKETGNNSRSRKFYLNAGLGASSGQGNSSARIQFIDINADGLPDKVDVDSQRVYYNLGYSFSRPYTFTSNVSEGYNINGGVNANAGTGLLNVLAHSIAQVSISGGVGGSMSSNMSQEQLMDINGDGLPDKIVQGTNGVQVAYNLGNRNFSTLSPLSQISSFSHDVTNSFNTTLGVTGGVSFEIVKFNIGIQASPYSTSSSSGKVLMTDMNGDGLVDYVYSGNDNLIHVCYNSIGQANLLKKVVNPTGQQINLVYTLSEPSTSHRSRQWNLTRIVNSAPNHPMVGAQNDTLEIDYEHAYYDNYEKTDYGYEYVRTTENREKIIKSVYHNKSFLQNGELKEESIMDVAGNTYIRHQHGNRYKYIGSNEETNIGDTICDDANIFVLKDGYWTDYYEKEATPQITTYYNIEYDQYHNMVAYQDDGDIAVPEDDWRKVVTYLPNSANNMISLPKTEKIYDSHGHLLRSSSANYSEEGDLAHIHFIDSIQNITATTSIQYDDFGNIFKVIYPKDDNGLHNWTTYEYDHVTYSNIVSIDNPHQVLTHTTYYYQWGVPKLIIGPVLDTIRYFYDYKGRLRKVLAPMELEREKEYTVKYTYNLINHNLRTTPSYPYTYVCKDMYDSLFVQKEISIFDERGRMMQKKHFAEEGGHDKWIVDGFEEWDVFGRTLAYGYPFKAQEDSVQFEPVSHAQEVIHYSYDIMDRPLVQTNTDATTKSFFYHFQSDSLGVLRLLNRVTDENSIVTATLKSPQDWMIQQIAGDGSYTFFKYSPIGELLQSTDADGYQTSYKYDMLGRLQKRTHPDAGETTLTYDIAGNLIYKKTENLAQTNDSIQYIYDYGRLTKIHYPHHKENDVSYFYDKAGRMSLRKDGTGSEAFVYDKLGNIAQTTRRIIIPTDNYAYVFRTMYKYDSFGRMRNIVYPDGEVVHYGYTTGGLLKNVAGTKHDNDIIYLWNRLYDAQGRKIFQEYGNGVATYYSYDNRQWLSQLYTESPSGQPLQDIVYKYDYVGNITDLMQTAPFVSSMGGVYANAYTYDQQYRLYQSSGFNTFPFVSDAEYSPAGRMRYKTTSFFSTAYSLMFGYDIDHLTHQPRTAYDSVTKEGIDLYWDKNGNLTQILNCIQDVARLHEWDEENRLKFVLGSRDAGYYGYDANNERVYKLTGISSIDHINSGLANALVTLSDATIYPNPYVVVTPRDYTKHYYAGTERLATVIGNGGLGDQVYPLDMLSTDEHNTLYEEPLSVYNLSSDPFYYEGVLGGIVENVNIHGEVIEELAYTCKPVELSAITIYPGHDILENAIYAAVNDIGPEQDVYYYHGDHLGSANWITDAMGHEMQYIHYAPYGDLIDNQMASTYDERYKFTGKERDAESGYDFFGARFYSSIFGHWLSVDPLADKYPNISSYAYCGWNPISRIDPDGKWVQIVVGAAISAASDYAFQVGMNMLNGDDFSTALTHDISIKSIAVSAAVGAAGVGVAKSINKAQQAVKLANNAQKVNKSTRVLENAKKGAEFERKVGAKLGKNKASQVTIEVKDGTKTRMDFVSVEDGNIKLTEAKSSTTAPLTPNQKTAHPQIEQYGGTIKGNNGSNIGLPSGTEIPPTKVDVVRPNNLTD